MEDGALVFVDAKTLAVVQRYQGTAAAAPMFVVGDDARRCFYVGNFRDGLARVPFAGGEPEVLDLGGATTGMAIDPRGQLLAVNGAHDLRLRLVDLDAWKLVAVAQLGNAGDPPNHSHLTHGLMSTHPVWEADGSSVLTEDNVHEAVLRVGRDGSVIDHVAMPAAVHVLLPRPGGGWLALGEGAVDGTAPPFVACIGAEGLAVERSVPLPLRPGELAKLHHGEVIGSDLLVVANMGPMHGDSAGRSVYAVDLQRGEVRWTGEGPQGSGHVRHLGGDRIAVLGHRDGGIAVLDLGDGHRTATWTVPGTSALGHAIEMEADGAVLVVDNGLGRLVRLREGVVANTSPSFGPGTWEASLRE
jgi:hypothetical protein